MDSPDTFPPSVMPPSSPADKLLEYASVAANALQDVAGITQIPFLSRVSKLTLAIIPMVQCAKFQRERCLRIVEDIHHSLCALTSLSIHLDDIQAPKMLDHIAQYAVTLQKFDSCLRSQRELGTIKRLFKQGKITAQLDACETELRALLAIFTAKQGAGLATALVEFNIDTETRHQELLEMISSQSSSFDTVSSIGQSALNASSGLFSLLPASPKIFHGRESVLEDLVNTLSIDPARVAILGPGGMGKTTLAMAALHHPKVANRYPTRYFISCESAHTTDSLVAIIGSHLGLDPSSASQRALVAMLSAGQPCLMILDNFETPWEPVECRAKVEEFLSLLTDIAHVALVVCSLHIPRYCADSPQITMRGAERPGKVGWTRPFLRPLMPLTPNAARQTFIDIADEVHDNSEVDRLLDITDNVPLAIQLVATIADAEGCQATLEHWERERTAILSAGYDKQSNLEISIMLSLSSPRLQSSPHAAELLGLMSLLSDGISDLALVQSELPISNISKCKTALVRTSLAYVDHAGRFKVLAPIREYIHLARPPSHQLVRPLRKYFIDILKVYESGMYSSSFMVDLVPRLVSNLGNLHNVLLHGLDSDSTDLRESILGVIMLNSLNFNMHRGFTPLMLQLPEILSGMDDHELHGRFITSVFATRHFYPIPNPEIAIGKAREHFRLIQDRDGEGEHNYFVDLQTLICTPGRLLTEVATYYHDSAPDLKKAEEFYSLALSVAAQCNSDKAKIRPLAGLARMEWRRGNYSRALQLAQQMYRIARALGNVRGELNGIRLQALCYSSMGHFKHGKQLLDQGKELVLRAGLQGGLMEFILMNIEAEVYLMKTEYSDARHIQEVILHQASTKLSPMALGSTLATIAFLDIVTGANADAVSRNLNAATTAFQNAHHVRGISLCDHCRADLLLREGDAMGARVEYMRLFAGTRNSDDEIACYCLTRLADPNNPMHADTESTRWAIVFLAFALRPLVRSPITVHQALQRLGDVFVRQSADNSALSVLAVALEGFTWMDVHRGRAECMYTMGSVYVRRGDIYRAREMWEAARPLFERSEQKKEVARIDEKLQTLGVAQKLHNISKVQLPILQATLHDSWGDSEEQKPLLISAQ